MVTALRPPRVSPHSSLRSCRALEVDGSVRSRMPANDGTGIAAMIEPVARPLRRIIVLDRPWERRHLAPDDRCDRARVKPFVLLVAPGSPLQPGCRPQRGDLVALGPMADQAPGKAAPVAPASLIPRRRPTPGIAAPVADSSRPPVLFDPRHHATSRPASSTVPARRIPSRASALIVIILVPLGARRLRGAGMGRALRSPTTGFYQVQSQEPCGGARTHPRREATQNSSQLAAPCLRAFPQRVRIDRRRTQGRR